MTHSERGYVVPDEGHCRALDDETGADKDSALFRETMKAIGPQSKKRVDDDLRIETEFFGLVKDKIPRRKRDDPAFMKPKVDIFEALPEELTRPDNMTEVQSPRSNPAAEARAPVAPTKKADHRPIATADPPPSSDGDDEDMVSSTAPPTTREMPPATSACGETSDDARRFPSSSSGRRGALRHRKIQVCER